MLAVLDVDYRGDKAIAACLIFHDWSASRPVREFTVEVNGVAPYEPGSFYKRELPCLLAALKQVTETLTAIVVDGNAWLDHHKPGLGARLHEVIALPVVGIAKSAFKGADFARKVYRGSSQNPLYVTAVDLDPSDAAHRVKIMHGEFRVPTLVRRVDRLCREA